MDLTIAEFEKNSRECVRISLREFKGAKLLDVRILAVSANAANKFAPTAKGVSVRIDLLRTLRDALEAADREGVALDWLESEEGR